MGSCTSRPEEQCRNAGNAGRRRRHLHHHHHHHGVRRGGSHERGGKKYLAPAANSPAHLLSSEPAQYSAPGTGTATANGQLQHQGSSRLTTAGSEGQRTPQGPPLLFGRKSASVERQCVSLREKGGEGDFDDYLSCNEDQFSVEGTPCVTPPLNRQVSQNVHSPPYHDAEYTSQPSSQKDNDPVLGRLVGCLPILGALNLANQNSAHRDARHYSDSECSESECGSEGPRPTAKPDAGCSLRPFKQPDGSDLGPEATEAYSDAGIYNVRGVDYPRTRTKQPGEPQLYKVAAADIFGFPCKRLNIAPSVNLPQPSPKCIASAKAAGLPPMIVFNISLPIYPAPIFGPYDGKCLSIVTYAHLPEDFDAEKFPNQAALGLIRRLVENGKEADGTMTRDRLKLVPRCANPEEWAQRGPLSQAEQALLTSYNEKPILTRPQQAFFPGDNYLEIDFDVHQYTYLARRAITTYMSRLKPVIWETAFIVQGNHPEELPEQVLAATRIFRLDFESVPPFTKFCEDAAQQQLKQQPSRLSIPSLPAPSNTQVLPDHPAIPADAPATTRQAQPAAESPAARHSGSHRVPPPPTPKEPSPAPAPSSRQAAPQATLPPKESPHTTTAQTTTAQTTTAQTTTAQTTSAQTTSAPLPPKAPSGPAPLLPLPPQKAASSREEGHKAHSHKPKLFHKAPRAPPPKRGSGGGSDPGAPEQPLSGGVAGAAKRSAAGKDAKGAAAAPAAPAAAAAPSSAAAAAATNAAAGERRSSSPGAAPRPSLQQQHSLPKSRSSRSREQPTNPPSPPARSATSHSPHTASPPSLSPSPSGAKRGSHTPHSPHSTQPPPAAAATAAAAASAATAGAAGKPPKAAKPSPAAKAPPMISPPSPPSESAPTSAAASPASHLSHSPSGAPPRHSLSVAPPPHSPSGAPPPHSPSPQAADAASSPASHADATQAAAASPGSSAGTHKPGGKRAAAKAVMQNGWSRARGKKGKEQGKEREKSGLSRGVVSTKAAAGGTAPAAPADAPKGAPAAPQPAAPSPPPPHSSSPVAAPPAAPAAAATPAGARSPHQHPASNGIMLPAAAAKEKAATQPQPGARSPSAAASAAAKGSSQAPHRSSSGRGTVLQGGGKAEAASKHNQGHEPWCEANGHGVKNHVQQSGLPGVPQHSVKVQQ